MRYLPLILLIVLISLTLKCMSSSITTYQRIGEIFATKAQKFSLSCVIESKANAGDVQELMQLKFSSRKEGKCFLYCLYRNLHVVKDGGGDLEGALNLMEEFKTNDPDFYERYSRVIRNCHKKSVVNPDPCEFSDSLNRCSEAETKIIDSELEKTGTMNPLF